MDPVNNVNQSERQNIVNKIMRSIIEHMYIGIKGLTINQQIENLSEKDGKELKAAIRQLKLTEELEKEVQKVKLGDNNKSIEKVDANEKKAKEVADKKVRSKNQIAQGREI